MDRFHFLSSKLETHKVSRSMCDLTIGNKDNRRAILRPNRIDTMIKGTVIVAAYFTFLIRNQSLDVDKLVPIPASNMGNKVSRVDG